MTFFTNDSHTDDVRILECEIHPLMNCKEIVFTYDGGKVMTTILISLFSRFFHSEWYFACDNVGRNKNKNEKTSRVRRRLIIRGTSQRCSFVHRIWVKVLQNTFSSIRDFWEHQGGEWRETSKQNCISMWRNIYLVVDKTWTPQKICFRHHIKYFSIISTEPSSFWFTSCLTGLWLKLRIRPSTDFYWREVRIISEAAT